MYSRTVEAAAQVSQVSLLIDLARELHTTILR
jgi:hypothetical protein